MGYTAQSYFIPSLMKISDYLKLSPNVAGVTLLALGNGINDIASIAIGVIFTGSTGFAVGGPVGSSLFITTIILGIVLMISHVEVGRYPFFRDTTVFLLTTVFVFYMYLMQRVQVWESIICLLFYVFYVLVVLLGPLVRKCLHKIKDKIVHRIHSAQLQEPFLPEDEILTDPEEDDDDWTGGWKKFPKFSTHLHYHQIEEKKPDERTLKRVAESIFNPPLEKGLKLEAEGKSPLFTQITLRLKETMPKKATKRSMKRNQISVASCMKSLLNPLVGEKNHGYVCHL